MNLEELTTERLLLRKLTPKEFTYIFDNYSDDEIKSLLGLNTDEELEVERKRNSGGYMTYDRTILAFLIVLKETGETIGRCGFHNWYVDHKKAELGYVLSKEVYRRQGYMSEAVNSILHYGFNAMGLNRIEACVGPDNIASLCVIRKHGFTQEGYLRKHYIRDNEIQDTMIFSLLKEEFE